MSYSSASDSRTVQYREYSSGISTIIPTSAEDCVVNLPELAKKVWQITIVNQKFSETEQRKCLLIANTDKVRIYPRIGESGFVTLDDQPLELGYGIYKLYGSPVTPTQSADPSETITCWSIQKCSDI